MNRTQWLAILAVSMFVGVGCGDDDESSNNANNTNNTTNNATNNDTNNATNNGTNNATNNATNNTNNGTNNGDVSARLQIIHNAADPAAEAVDVYVNDELFLDDFEFRTATPFTDVPSGVDLEIKVAPGDSTTSADAVFNATVNLEAGKAYIAVANGVLDPASFNSNPDDEVIGFGIWVKADAREVAADAASFEFVAVHGATDAPAVDIVAGELTLVPNAKYGAITDYIAVPPAAYTLDINVAGTDTTVVSYSVDASGFAGLAATVLASGFLTPEANGDGPAFALAAYLPTGGPAILLPVAE
jgi:hypothetical protein